MEYFDEILPTHWYWQEVAKGSSNTICQIPFVIGRGFDEVQILKKKWNWSYLLNLLAYFDKIVHTHYSWQDLDRGIAKSHLSLVEAMPRSKFWKSETEMDITHFPM